MATPTEHVESTQPLPPQSRSAAFKARLRAGETLVGAWLTIPDIAVAEIFADAGFDFVIIDAEHAPWSASDVQSALAGFNGSSTVVLVRPPIGDAMHVTQMLDVGADGILCPSVRSLAAVEDLVRAAKYPPDGVRGFGPRRAARYGRDTDAYTSRTNAEVIIVPQIENTDVLPDLDAILELDGVDAICVGPTDLSGSLGVLRQFDHPTLVETLDMILAKAKARGIAVCTGIVVAPDTVPDWVARGARMPLVTADTALLVEGAADSLRVSKRA